MLDQLYKWRLIVLPVFVFGGLALVIMVPKQGIYIFSGFMAICIIAILVIGVKIYFEKRRRIRTFGKNPYSLPS